MKFDNDSKERARVLLSFLLEAYKICMGCFLTVFVAHNCPESGEECSVTASFRPQTHAGMVAIVVNGATFGAICTLYGVELLRENWCITHLDIDPSFPDLHLSEVASESVQHQLLAWNNRYWKAALASMVLVVANIVISVLYLAANYRGLGTATSMVSFSILVLMKLWRSFSMARQDRTTVRARSAYMTEYTSFNVLDEDHYPRKEAKDAMSLENELGCDDIVLEEEV